MDTFELLHGNNLEILPTIDDNTIDSIVTDPPYELAFMGKKWDGSGIAYNVELWRECLRVLKPGGHLLAFGGTRTYHRMTCAIEDATFEIRDSIHWLYSSGFPKSLDVSKGIDKAAGAEREIVGPTKRGAQSTSTGKFGAWGEGITPTIPATDEAKKWDGWGTALKPAHEPIVLARKPFKKTIINNVLEHGTGAINIDETRVGKNLWPSNILLDEQLAQKHPDWCNYFFISKASSKERNAGLDLENIHPTVKPIALMRYLVRLITPPNGTVLDPFAGSGTTMVAAILENKHTIGIELTADYLPLIQKRCEWAINQTDTTPKSLLDNQPTLFD